METLRPNRLIDQIALLKCAESGMVRRVSTNSFEALIDPDDNVARILYLSATSGSFYRDLGDWIPMDPDDDLPFDLIDYESVRVDQLAVVEWDVAEKAGTTLSRVAIAMYVLDDDVDSSGPTNRWQTDPRMFDHIISHGPVDELSPVDVVLSPVDDVTATVAELRANPLARLMPGSRELFHSNLLAWYFDVMAPQAMPVFQSLAGLDETPNSAASIRRESANLDLVVLDDAGKGFVLENKVFSLPDTEQLDLYAAKIRKSKDLSGARPVLLSLADPLWPQNEYTAKGRKSDKKITWTRISYAQLAAWMRRSIPADATSYEWETVDHYCSLIESLDELADRVTEISDHTIPYAETLVADDDSFGNQIRRSLAKLEADAIAAYVRSRLAETTLRRSVRPGMSNSLPLVEAFYTKTGHKKTTAAGWQLQGGRLRLFANIPSLEGRTEAARQKRIHWGNSHLGLFDFDGIAATLGTDVASAGPVDGFNRFDPAFIYRSIPAANMTVGQLVSIAEAHQETLETSDW